MTDALYARISKTVDEHSASIDRQIADCRTALQRAGTVGEPTLFVDANRSAWQRTRKRPGWDDMLTQIRTGQITRLAVWHPDRLMRQPRDLEDLIDAADRGLQLLSVGGDRDLANADDRMVLRFLIAAACKASDDSSRRIRRALQDRAAAGLSHGGGRPFGVTPDGTGLVDVEAEAVRDAACQVLQGASLRSICRQFDEAGLRSVRGASRWSQPTLRGILLRPSVAGFHVHQGQVVGRTAHPPILDEGVWRATVDVLTDPGRCDTRVWARRHLLSGLLYCTRCEGVGNAARMRSLKQSGSDRRRYACPACFRNAASEAQLDALVLAAVGSRLAVTDAPAAADPNADEDISELAALRARLDLVTREFTDDPDVSPAQLRVMSKRLRDRIRLLEQQATGAAAAEVVRFDGWADGPFEDRVRIVGAFVERIDLTPAGKAGRYVDPGRVSIFWR